MKRQARGVKGDVTRKKRTLVRGLEMARRDVGSQLGQRNLCEDNREALVCVEVRLGEGRGLLKERRRETKEEVTNRLGRGEVNVLRRERGYEGKVRLEVWGRGAQGGEGLGTVRVRLRGVLVFRMTIISIREASSYQQLLLTNDYQPKKSL